MSIFKEYKNLQIKEVQYGFGWVHKDNSSTDCISNILEEVDSEVGKLREDLALAVGGLKKLSTYLRENSVNNHSSRQVASSILKEIEGAKVRKPPKVEYISKAEWSKTEPSSDTHTSEAMAKGVARRLIDDHRDNPCPIRGRCLESWVDEYIDDKYIRRVVIYK